MKVDFARGKCPICGQSVKFRQNKNGILYTYCDYGHHAKLGRSDSVQATAEIKAGRPWNNGTIYLYPLTNETKGNQNGTNESNTTGTNSIGTDFGRRADGQPAAVSIDSGKSDDPRNSGSDNRDDDDFGFF